MQGWECRLEILTNNRCIGFILPGNVVFFNTKLVNTKMFPSIWIQFNSIFDYFKYCCAWGPRVFDCIIQYNSGGGGVSGTGQCSGVWPWPTTPRGFSHNVNPRTTEHSAWFHVLSTSCLHYAEWVGVLVRRDIAEVKSHLSSRNHLWK